MIHPTRNEFVRTQLRTSVQVVLVTTLGMMLVSGSAMANPSSKDPNRPMALHETIPGSLSLARNAHAVCLQAEQMIFDLQDSIERGDRRPKHKADAVLDMVRTVWKAKRDAEHCAMMGEPFGSDLKMRAAYLNGPLKNALIMSNSRSNELARVKGQSIKRLMRGKQGLFRFIAQAEAGLASGKHMRVQKEMASRGADLYRDTFLLNSSERNPLIGNFFSVLQACDNQVKEQLLQEYGAVAQTKAQEELAKLGQFGQECQRVITEIKDSKTVTLADEQSGDAADAFEHLVSQWGATSTAVTRAYAMRFPFTRGGKSEARDALEELETTAISNLTRLIDTATEASDPEEVPGLHTRLLASTASAARRIEYPSDFEKACQSSLERMIKKNPDYGRQVLRYERATREALRWRRDFSSQRASFLARRTKTIPTIMTKDVSSKNAYRPPIRSKAIAPKKYAPTWTQYPSHWLIRHLAGGTVGQIVQDDHVIRPSLALPICVVPYRQNHYANVLVPTITTEAIRDLEYALLVDSKHPALSFNASDAVSSAHRHDYEKVAGVIKGVRVEGTITRFVKLPSGASVLTPLGSVPSFSPDKDPMYERCYRFDLEPIWLQHKYFTVGDLNQ